MEKQPDYWAGWMDGWAAATNAIFSAQHRQGAQPPPAALEVSLPEAAGNKPTPRKRGRPPKAAALLASEPPKRKRGRPPKNRPA